MVSFLSQERLLTQEEQHPTTRGDDSKQRELSQTTNQITTTTTPRKWLGHPVYPQPDVAVDRDHGDVGSCCRWTEDDYLRVVVPWESLEQRAYIDFLLERRAHYRMVYRLSVVVSILVMVFMLGCTMVVGVLMSHLWVVGILVVAPLICMSWEGNHQHAAVDVEIQKWTKQRLILIPTPPQRWEL